MIKTFGQSAIFHNHLSCTGSAKSVCQPAQGARQGGTLKGMSVHRRSNTYKITINKVEPPVCIIVLTMSLDCERNLNTQTMTTQPGTPWTGQQFILMLFNAVDADFLLWHYMLYFFSFTVNAHWVCILPVLSWKCHHFVVIFLPHTQHW